MKIESIEIHLSSIMLCEKRRLIPQIDRRVPDIFNLGLVYVLTVTYIVRYKHTHKLYNFVLWKESLNSNENVNEINYRKLQKLLLRFEHLQCNTNLLKLVVFEWFYKAIFADIRMLDMQTLIVVSAIFFILL